MWAGGFGAPLGFLSRRARSGLLSAGRAWNHPVSPSGPGPRLLSCSPGTARDSPDPFKDGAIQLDTRGR